MDRIYNRINAIKHSDPDKFYKENYLLFSYALKEYLRRISWWKAAVGFETNMYSIMIEAVFFDIVKKINPDWTLSIDDEEKIKYPWFSTDYDKRIIQNYVHWEKRKNEDVIQNYLKTNENLLPHYEPLIKLYEIGGGGIRRSDGGIGYAGSPASMSVFIEAYRQTKPFVLLNDDSIVIVEQEKRY